MAEAIAYPLCHLDDLADGDVSLVPNPAGASPATLLLLRSAGQVRGFENRCPHFGVPLAQRQEHLLFVPHVSLSCNVHYSRFRWHDGVCEFGDCEGEALRPVVLRLDANDICLIADKPTDSDKQA